MTPFEIDQRRLGRQHKVFQMGTVLREKLGGSQGPIEERLEHIRIAALGAVAEARGVMHALRMKGLITEREEQDALDWGYQNLLEQVALGQTPKVQGHG